MAEAELQDFMSIAKELEVEGLKNNFEKYNKGENDGTIQERSEDLTVKNPHHQLQYSLI